MRIENRKARHDYVIEDQIEAGIKLQGWEIKAIRAGKMSIAESYVRIINGAPVLLGATITPLLNASTHVSVDSTRTRTLLMHASEINRLIGKVQKAGYTLVPLNIHFVKGMAKLDIGVAKGKQAHDKRQAEKEKDATREVARSLKVRM